MKFLVTELKLPIQVFHLYLPIGLLMNRGNKSYYERNIPWVKSGELNKGLITDTEEKISDEAIKKSSVKVFPKVWKIVELKNLVVKISDGPFGSNLKSIDYVDDGIRVIRL